MNHSSEGVFRPPLPAADPSMLLQPAGLEVLVMGLGLNGGGLASARYFAARGARVTVTDLASEDRLRPSLEQLKAFPIHWVLGRHDPEDFRRADLVVKNPGVRPDSPFLRLARRVTTDIQVFLAHCRNPLFAVTGSKGKSTTAAALAHLLRAQFPATLLGGNIARSPLDQLEALDGVSPVVLELSSWQLGDLNPPEALRCRCAAITNLLHDHQNFYPSMEAYARDKERLFAGQGPGDWALVNLENPWGASFAEKSRADLCVVAFRGRIAHPRAKAWAYYQDGEGILEWKGRRVRLVSRDRLLTHPAGSWALLFAAAMAVLGGADPRGVRESSRSFAGLEHRMEICHRWRGVTFINDTAATIPEAAAVSYRSLSGRVHWIVGGTDKNLSLDSFQSLDRPPASLVLLEGSATRRMMVIFQAKGWGWLGPFTSLTDALWALRDRLVEGDTVLLSPGAASFELFLNEFDRGERFRSACRELYD